MAAAGPKPGDTNNNLLWKILTLFGGTPASADNANRLLQKILQVSASVSSGVETLTYAASVELNFNTQQDKTISLTGNVAFTTANLSAGGEVSVRIIADGSLRTLGFPVGWTFVGTAPTDIAANKTGVLSLKAYGSADSDVVAAYSVEA